jgi:O-methyltransferase domain/Dimerisation domain
MTPSPSAPPPGVVMRDMLTAYWTSACLIAAAKLGLADLLASGPKTPAELAKATGTQPEPLYRLLRALTSNGVFAEDEQGRFALTPLAEMLRDDVPGSQRAMAILMGDEHFRAWGELEHSLRTGKVAFDHVFGKPCFDFLVERPDKAANFDKAMVSIHGRETAAMVDAFDFSAFKTLADVGGGNGSLITHVLKRTPTLKGILYDLPHVVARAKANLQAAGVADRCQAIGGSFFEGVPAGADAYLMRHIIHDWDDAKSLTILGHVRKVIPANGKLLLIEGVVPPGNGPSFTKMLDLNMMLIPGGKERTEAEYRELYKKAGFRLTRIVPTASEVSVIEGVPT